MGRRLLRIVVLLLPTALPGVALPQNSPVPDLVEEDWQVVIANPTATGPQISTSMAPAGGTTAPALIFNLNYRDEPNFQAGGLQIKVLDAGSQVTAQATGGSGASCATANESITWTQSLSASNGSLTYEIKSGHSTTWGDFGGDNDTLQVSVPASVNSLAAYKPDDSVASSGVNFQANRVTSMTLLQVRYYQASNLIKTDDTPRPLTLLPK